ncbi:hypothetical protein C943_02787 [Mariniradius saccharolyticus AK6]|uniref:Uncharacterized protein n=1 Tax=Mariniradius saccharolyticus AK6 TaxID=1239962 RepID=M7X083_9BACT|nr:hypothetical protein C943_02787 [Mariniradius saccharolyticus AK6]
MTRVPINKVILLQWIDHYFAVRTPITIEDGMKVLETQVIADFHNRAEIRMEIFVIFW